MNILPKKSWHVRNKDNVARVRRDEENARLEEEKKAHRAALAEQEARTALLRSKAKTRSTGDSLKCSTADKALVPQDKQSRHINFFADVEEGLRQGSNPEYEAEKKAEQEKAEKAIGLLTYLGQSAPGGQGNTPWYLSASREEEAPENNKESNKKAILDPLQSMKKHLKVKAQSEHKKKKRDSESHRKHKKHKNDKESKRLKSHKKSIEELRRERLKREKEERERERQLLASVRGEGHPTSTSSVTQVPQRYNSQFHPELARKPRNDSRRYQPY